MNVLKRFNDVARSLLSDSGTLSTKLLFGSVCMLMYIGCTTYAVITDGVNEYTEQLLDHALIAGGCMLGINSIVSIFRPGSKYSHKKLDE